jgi:hypothetical protein
MAESTFDTKMALAGIQSFEDAARTLRDIPELRPVAYRMLAPMLQLSSNGHTEPAAPQPRKKRVGLHWTQRPENRAKVMKLARKMQKGK